MRCERNWAVTVKIILFWLTSTGLPTVAISTVTCTGTCINCPSILTFQWAGYIKEKTMSCWQYFLTIIWFKDVLTFTVSPREATCTGTATWDWVQCPSILTLPTTSCNGRGNMQVGYCSSYQPSLQGCKLESHGRYIRIAKSVQHIVMHI